MNIDNAVAFVTGANRGIGHALVEELLAGGARRVYAGARDPRALEPLVAVHDGRLIALPLDVTNAAQVASAARTAADVNLLINNAGVLAAYSVLSTPTETIEREFATNFYGTLGMTRAFLPTLEREHGTLVNVLTVASLASMPGLGGYAATKAAAFSLTQALRGELAPRGVRVHAVFPGPVDTDMSREIKVPKTGAQEVARAILRGIAAGDEDIAPDPMSQQVLAQWKRDPKSVERQFGTL